MTQIWKVTILLWSVISVLTWVWFAFYSLSSLTSGFFFNYLFLWAFVILLTTPFTGKGSEKTLLACSCFLIFIEISVLVTLFYWFIAPADPALASSPIGKSSCSN